MSEQFFNWAMAHWFLATIVMLSVIQAVVSLVSRTYRVILVLTRGWPQMPLMDADGDIVHPKRDK